MSLIINDRNPNGLNYLCKFLKILILCILGSLGPFIGQWYGYRTHVEIGGCVLSVFVLLWIVKTIFIGQQLVFRNLSRIALFVLFFIFGWWIGLEARKVHCRQICSSCQPLIKSLEQYRSHNGMYPNTLVGDILQEYNLLWKNGDYSIQQNSFLREKLLDVSQIEKADITIFLDQDYYVFLVPVDKKLPISHTGFYVYRLTSKDIMWHYDFLTWRLAR